MDHQNAAAGTPRFASFTLDAPIVVGTEVVHEEGTTIQVRRPNAGELRGIDISATISRCDFAQIEKLAPRITLPILHPHHVAAMDPADFVQLGGEIVDFLLPKAVRQAGSQTE
ncbi:MAG TPA: phage tail assembly protein [Sphingomonas sp.]|jgi:hypothetical protein